MAPGQYLTLALSSSIIHCQTAEILCKMAPCQQVTYAPSPPVFHCQIIEIYLSTDIEIICLIIKIHNTKYKTFCKMAPCQNSLWYAPIIFTTYHVWRSIHCNMCDTSINNIYICIDLKLYIQPAITKSEALNINRKISKVSWSHTLNTKLRVINLTDQECIVMYCVIWLRDGIYIIDMEIFTTYLNTCYTEIFVTNTRNSPLRLHVKWRHAQIILKFLYHDNIYVSDMKITTKYLNTYPIEILVNNTCSISLGFYVKWRHAKSTLKSYVSYQYIRQ